MEYMLKATTDGYQTSRFDSFEKAAEQVARYKHLDREVKELTISSNELKDQFKVTIRCEHYDHYSVKVFDDLDDAMEYARWYGKKFLNGMPYTYTIAHRCVTEWCEQ